MGRNVSYDLSEYREFFDRLSAAAKGEFRHKLELWLDAIGNDFLRVVEEEIIRRKVMRSRELLASFHKGSSDGVYILDVDGLTLEVGTSVAYAGYVNDGHWTNPKGVDGRWVPGTWNGDEFIYDHEAKSGMYLKQHWVKGEPYFDSALRAFEKIFNTSLEKMMAEWFEEYFGK